MPSEIARIRVMIQSGNLFQFLSVLGFQEEIRASSFVKIRFFDEHMKVIG
jgi:hypothetical protein